MVILFDETDEKVMLLTCVAGAAGEVRTVNWLLLLAADAAQVVTTTLPAPVLAPADSVATKVVGTPAVEVTVAAAPLMVTAEPVVKPVPVIVTEALLPVHALVGDKPVTVGVVQAIVLALVPFELAVTVVLYTGVGEHVPELYSNI